MNARPPSSDPLALLKALNGPLSSAHPGGASCSGDVAGIDAPGRTHSGRARRCYPAIRIQYRGLLESCSERAVRPVPPGSVIRACAQNALLTKPDARLAMDLVDDRNLTACTYSQALAQAIWSHLPVHLSVLQRWLATLEPRTSTTL